jgi:hypothetical protein
MQLPSKINPDKSEGKKDKFLKEDNSVDSLHTYTSFVGAGHTTGNQEKIGLTKSLIESSMNVNLLLPREITPKLGQQHPPSRLTENK